MRYEIVGANEMLVGYDEEVAAYLGASPASFARALSRRGTRVPARYGRAAVAPAGVEYNRAREMATAVKTVDAGSILREVTPTKARALVFGMTSLAVAAAGTVIVTQNPQVLFRPQRIIVPATIAPSFVINDIITGNKSQLATAGAVPAEAFTQNADNAPTMLMDTLGISMNFSLNITNISGAPADFRCAVFGEAVD